MTGEVISEVIGESGRVDSRSVAPTPTNRPTNCPRQFDREMLQGLLSPNGIDAEPDVEGRRSVAAAGGAREDRGES